MEGENNSYCRGLVKLRQPRAGYAFVNVGGWDPRDVANWTMDVGLTDVHGRELNRKPLEHCFDIYESLQEATRNIGYLIIPPLDEVKRSTDIERLTTAVRQALDFVETGQPPKPETISFAWEGGN